MITRNFSNLIILFFIYIPISITPGTQKKLNSILTKLDTNCHFASVFDGLIYIDCIPGYATDHDSIILIDPAHNIDFRLGEKVGLISPTQGALLFDVHADNTINLAIEFSLSKENVVIAKLFDDRTGDGIVSVNYSENETVITEPGPVIVFNGIDGWWYKNGITNFNLDVYVDGSLLAYFGPLWYSKLFEIDGNFDVVLHVRDTNYDGDPDLEWRQIYLPLSEMDGYNRTQVIVNTMNNEKPIDGAIVWPYLGDLLKNPSAFTKPSYFSSSPPIDVDWSISKITHLNEFVGSRSNAGNYFIYSHNRLVENEISVGDFESPFAFYDLSQGKDIFPNLMIRSVYYPEKDKYISSLLLSLNKNPINGFLYVWRFPNKIESNAPIWDYKISVLGSYPAEAILDIGELKIKTFDPTNLASWVLDNPWEFAIFVANQGGNQPNSEGISPWGTTLEQISPYTYKYLSGEADDFPLDYFNAIDQGYRGEVAPYLRGKLYVYYSPIDNLLHLFHSDFGVWNINQSENIQFADSDEDGFIDHWIYKEDNDPVQELWCLSGQIIYFDHRSRTLRWKNGVCQGNLFQPPRDHNSWENLRISQEKSGGAVRSLNLLQLFEDHAGVTWGINGAMADNLRSTEQGYRFSLSLLPGFTIEGPDWFGLNGKPPGDYLVELSDSIYIKPLTPAQISIDLHFLEVNQPVVYRLIPIQVDLINEGLEDTNDAILIVEATNGEETTQVTSRTVDLLSQIPLRLDGTWQPSQEGEWQLISRIEDPNGKDLVETRNSIFIQKLGSGVPGNIARISSYGFLLPVLILLLTSAGFSTGIFFSAWTKQD